MTKLSLVIVEYLGAEDALEAVSSAARAAGELDLESIVVSNSAYDRPRRRALATQREDVVWIFNPENVGFATAVNQGLARASGDVVLLLNPDARVLSTNLEAAVEFLLEHPGVGLLGPRVEDAEGRVVDSFRCFVTPFGLVSRQLRRLVRGAGVHRVTPPDRATTVDWVSGCAMLVRRDAIEVVGAMDEGFFMYVEDMDWCRRFWQEGLEVVYWPALEVFHQAPRASSSSPLRMPFRRLSWVHLRGYLRFWRKSRAIER